MSDQNLPLRLEVNSHVIRQLGDELITDTGQALLELVKNSYDADADYCHVQVDTKCINEFDLPEIRRTISELDNPTSKTKVDRKFSLKGCVIVTDNGTGMSLSDVRRGWLTISLSPKRLFKQQGKITEKHHRTPLGDKGLGRIGTLKLGSYIVIETHHSVEANGLKVSFSWGDCEEGSVLSDIPIVRQEVPPKGSTGTVLSIYGLNDLEYWENSNTPNSLGNQFSTLISPFKDFVDFNVLLSINSTSISIQRAENYLNASQGEFTAIWQKPLEETSQLKSDTDNEYLVVDGKIKLLLFRRTTNDPKFRHYLEPDKGEEFYQYLLKQEKIKSFGVKRAESGWYVKFRKAYKRDDLSEFLARLNLTDPGPLMAQFYDIDIVEAKNQINNIPEFLKKHNGMFIYRDNFRIRMGDDWLGLGERQTKGGSFYGLRPGNTLGWISISARDNQNLIEKSDREGFIDNAAKRGFEYILGKATEDINDFITLCRRAYNDFVKNKQNVAEKRGVEYDDATALGELKGLAADVDKIAAALMDNANILNSVKSVHSNMEQGLALNDSKMIDAAMNEANSLKQTLHSRIKEIPNLISAVKIIPHAVKTISDSYDSDDNQMRELYAVAATGLAAEGLVHEISDVVQTLAHALGDLEKVAKVLGIKNAKFFENIHSAQACGKDVVSRIRFIDPMLRNVRVKRDVIEVNAFMDKLKKHKVPVFEQHHIEFILEKSVETFSIEANTGRIMQVFDNLIRNSLYWLTLFSKMEHNVVPTLTVSVSKPTVRIFDNGYGVDEGIAANLFDAFVSGKKDGNGHGLGLYISRELLKEEKSSIILLPDLNIYKKRYIFEIDFEGAMNE